jgi:hypothetical protein
MPCGAPAEVVPPRYTGDDRHWQGRVAGINTSPCLGRPACMPGCIAQDGNSANRKKYLS